MSPRRSPVAAAACGVFFLFVGCQRHFDMAEAETLARMENPVYRGKPVPRGVIDQLVPLIQKYKEKAEAYAADAENLQLLYKNVAQRYLDIGYYEQQIDFYLNRLEAGSSPPEGGKEKAYYDYAALLLQQKGLYAHAYENILKSLKLAPRNELLLYNAGYSAALLGKAMRPENEVEALPWFEKALEYYELALQVDPDYIDALYGASIVLVYELGRPEEAVPKLLRIKEKNAQNIEALFVLAAAYAVTGSEEASLKEYANIERIAVLEEQKKAARENMEKLQGNNQPP